MAIEVTTFDPDDSAEAAEWNRYVERSPNTNPFFRAEALSLQAAATETTAHLLAGFKGQEAVGLFPIFAYRKGPLTAAFSPAPYSWSCYLGPAMVNMHGLKQRKVDSRTKRFIEGCLEWLAAELSPVYTQINTGEFADVRPFVWEGYDIQPRYTYVVDLEGTEDDILGRFSSDARRNVTNTADEAYLIEEGDGFDVETVVDQVRTRYENQGEAFHLSPSFARRLYETLPDGSIRPYVCRIDGETMGGILVVESETTRYRWQGGVKPDLETDVPINDLLDWHVMRDGLREGIERYDLVGAGVPSINRYKAKFNPRLQTQYTITTGAFGLDLLIDGYRKVV